MSSPSCMTLPVSKLLEKAGNLIGGTVHDTVHSCAANENAEHSSRAQVLLSSAILNDFSVKGQKRLTVLMWQPRTGTPTMLPVEHLHPARAL